MSRGRAKNRPPRLESRPVEAVLGAPPSPEQLLQRAKVAGPAAAPGEIELRRFVERISAGDRRAWGAMLPIEGITSATVWQALAEVFGCTAVQPALDPAATLEGARRAAVRIRDVAATGARVACVTAAPASLLGVHLAVARMVREAGAELAEETTDAGPFRADGRAGRALRWIDGVATVSDGHSLLATADAEAAREWLFVIPRPALVVADGPFAEAAWDAGVEVVAFAGLDRAALAVPAARGNRCTVVPCRTDRPPAAYGALIAQLLRREM